MRGEVGGEGRHVWQRGVCMAKGGASMAKAEGACMVKRACVARGVPTRGVIHGKGACMVGGERAWRERQPLKHPTGMHSCSQMFSLNLVL